MQISQLVASNAFSATDVLAIEINNVTYKLTGATLASALQSIGLYATESELSDSYDNTATYAVGDYCIYGNTLYKCNTAITTAEEWNAAHWTATNVADELQGRLKPSDVVNNLSSTATDKPGSANMLKALNDKIIGRKPTTLSRPISGNQTTDWTYTALHDGTLYLVFVGTIRSYCSVLWNDAYIAAVAFADNSTPLANTITVNVKKNDIIKVIGLNANCYLISTQTAFIANGVDV